MNYRYYYNQVPGHGPQRNNLVYTSLISEDNKVFVQWYYNDTDYHKGQNEVLDPDKMDEKWQRELKYLKLMNDTFPKHVPKILDIDYVNRKVYLEIDGVDFWNRANCDVNNFINVVPDWEEQMLTILSSHKNLGLYKFSLHPSSYFVVEGKLKSINYFFCYHESEGPISIANHSSHIHSNRQKIVREQISNLGLSWDKPESLNMLQNLCFESFRSNYNNNFIEQAKRIYSD